MVTLKNLTVKICQVVLFIYFSMKRRLKKIRTIIQLSKLGCFSTLKISLLTTHSHLQIGRYAKCISCSKWTQLYLSQLKFFFSPWWSKTLIYDGRCSTTFKTWIATNFWDMDLDILQQGLLNKNGCPGLGWKIRINKREDARVAHVEATSSCARFESCHQPCTNLLIILVNYWVIKVYIQS